MNRFFLAFCLANTLSSVFAAPLPAEYVGIWATQGAQFAGDVLLSGRAVLVDRDGTAVIIGSSTSQVPCSIGTCPYISGIVVHVDLGNNGRSLILSGKDASGNVISGTGFNYDEVTDTLQTKMLVFGDEELIRHSRSVPPELMRQFVDALRMKEADVPRGVMTYLVPSDAMKPTLTQSQLVKVNSEAYAKALPRRGDIVSYQSEEHNGDIYIHRVAALPGETIEIRNGTVIVSGKELDEPFLLPNKALAKYSKTFALQVVPPGTIFLLGDNRDNSLDSRFQGPISLKAITGKIEMVKTSMFDGEFKPVK